MKDRSRKATGKAPKKIVHNGKTFLSRESAISGLGVNRYHFFNWLGDGRTWKGVPLEVFHDPESRHTYLSEDSRTRLMTRFISQGEFVGPFTIRNKRTLPDSEGAPDVLMSLDYAARALANSFSIWGKKRLMSEVREIIVSGAQKGSVRPSLVTDPEFGVKYVSERDIVALRDEYAKVYDPSLPTSGGFWGRDNRP